MKGRLTWDEAKRAADGSLHPRLDGQPAGTQDFQEKHRRLKSDWLDAQTKAEDAQERADELWSEVKALENRMASLGIEVIR